MSDMQTYEGSCHCGAVKYEVKAKLDGVMSCNCSICSRTGALLAFVPAEQFTLRSGEGRFTDYQFARKNIHHYFCSTCGVRSFARGTGPDGKPMAAINVRCLQGLDYDALPVKKFDGKAL